MVGPVRRRDRHLLAGLLGLGLTGRPADAAATGRLPDQLGSAGVVVVLVAQPHRMRRLLHAGSSGASSMSLV